MADPFGFNPATPEGGYAPDWARNLLNFGLATMAAANQRDGRGFLTYGNGALGSIGAGGMQAMQQAQETARLRAGMGLQALQGQHLQGENRLLDMQTQELAARLKMMNDPSFLNAQPPDLVPYASGGAPGGAAPAADSGRFTGPTYADAIIGGEGSGKSGTSSAAGVGQFTEGTFQQFAAAHPALFQGMSPQQVLAMRDNKQIGRMATEWLAGQNAQSLKAAGVDPTGQALGLAHYQGPTAAAALMKADADKPVAPVLAQSIGLQAASAYVKANPELGRMTVGQLRDRYKNVPAFEGAAVASAPAPAAPGAPFRVAAATPAGTATDAPTSLLDGTPAAPPPASPGPGPASAPAPAGPAPGPTPGGPGAAAPAVPQFGGAQPPPMPQPDANALSMANYYDARARQLAVMKLPNQVELQNAQTYRQMAFKPITDWQAEMTKLGFAGPNKWAEVAPNLYTEWNKPREMSRPGAVLMGPNGPIYQNPLQVQGRDSQGHPTTNFVTPAMPGGNPGSMVTGLSPTEDSYQKGRGKELADYETKVETEADAARQSNFLFDQMRNESKSWDMGKFAPVEGNARGWLKAVGQSLGLATPGLDEKLADYEAFNKNAMKLTQEAVRATSARAAVQEFTMIQQALPAATTSARGFGRIVDQLQSVNDFRDARQAALAKWKESHATPDGFDVHFNSQMSPATFLLRRMEATPEGQQEFTNLMANLSKTTEGRARVQKLMKSYAYAKDNGFFGEQQ